MSDIIEIVNDVAVPQYRLSFGRRGSVLVDPDAWDGFAEAQLADLGKAEEAARPEGVEAVMRVLAGFLATHLADANPGVTADDVMRLRLEERRKILRFFVNPEAALQAQPAAATPTLPATPPPTPALPAGPEPTTPENSAA